MIVLPLLVSSIAIITGTTENDTNINLVSLCRTKGCTWNATASCKQSCGIDKYPCSCSYRCLVHKNCCEDMAIECPHTLQEARENFTNLLTAQVECYVNFYMISGCPTDVNKTLSNKNIASLKINITHQKDTYFDHILKMCPVTDATTGFAYKNLSVFDCNASNYSLPLLWSFVPNDINVLSEKYQKFVLMDRTHENIHFVPPLNLKPSIHPVRCEADIIKDCNNILYLSDYATESKCHEFTSYVNVTKKFEITKVYKNIYCAICNGERIEDIESMRDIGQQISLGLPIIVSLTPTNFVVKVNPKLKSNHYSWSSLTCNHTMTYIKELDIAQHNCRIETCVHKFQKRPNGLCKKRYDFQIAFPQNWIPHLQLQAQRHLPVFVKCFFQGFNGLEIDGEVQQKKHNVRISTSFLVWKFTLHDEFYDINGLHLNFERVDTLAKVLRKFFNFYNFSALSEVKTPAGLRLNVTSSDVVQELNLSCRGMTEDYDYDGLLACACVSWSNSSNGEDTCQLHVARTPRASQNVRTKTFKDEDSKCLGVMRSTDRSGCVTTFMHVLGIIFFFVWFSCMLL